MVVPSSQWSGCSWQWESQGTWGSHFVWFSPPWGVRNGQQSTGSRQEGDSLHTQPRLTETHNQPVQMTKASLGSHRGCHLRHPDTTSHLLQLCRLPAAGLTVAGAPGGSDWRAPGGHFSPALSLSLHQGPLVSQSPICVPIGRTTSHFSQILSSSLYLSRFFEEFWIQGPAPVKNVAPSLWCISQDWELWMLLLRVI